MNKPISLIVIVFLSVFIFGRAYAQEETSIKHEVVPFDSIEIGSASFELEIIVGQEHSILIEGHKINAQALKYEVKGTTLDIFRNEGKKTWDRSGNSKLKVTITMQEFKELELRGAVDAKITGIDSEKVKFELNGAGNFEVSGKCQSLELDFKGAGNFEGQDLKCEEVNVELKGVGNIEVYASKEIDAEIKGMGNIEVYGSPQIVNKESGFFSSISIH
jgi:hypothetical protein